jgi:hypothetical protein
MRVEPDILRDGADVSRNAGQMARIGADALSQAAIRSGVFGDFDDAHAFHSKLTAGHRSYVQAMHATHQTLTEVGDKVHTVATSFEETESRNRATIDAVPDA